MLQTSAGAWSYLWYNSNAYQALVRIRQSASTADFILLDGRP